MGYKNIVEDLIAKDATDLDEKDKYDGDTLLMKGTFFRTLIFNLFLTSIFQACSSGDINLTKSLLDHNANVNAKNNETPLELAYSNGKHDIFKLLLQKNANVDQKDNNGKTLLMKGDKKLLKIIELTIFVYSLRTWRKRNYSRVVGCQCQCKRRRFKRQYGLINWYSSCLLTI
jgi:hypothetical protein